MNAKAVLLSAAAVIFLSSIAMMIVAEHVYDGIFLVGFGLFSVSITILITAIFWNIAGGITNLKNFE